MRAEDQAALPDWLDVSRETHDRLCDLLALVAKWNPAINLVSRGSLEGAWVRHVLDSAQLFDLGHWGATVWADFGSGGGFPGLVLAVIAAEKTPELRMVLVESDRRKAAFLEQAGRALGLSAQIVCSRVELLDPLMADVVTARALAPLTVLCGHAHRHLKPAGRAIFPKGGRIGEELALAGRFWRSEFETVQSRTDPAGSILMLRNIRHA